VLQTVLMPLILADEPNMLAPPFDFIERIFLPMIIRMGPSVSARIVRHGFYPRGGRRIEVDITPAPLLPIVCIERGEQLGVPTASRTAQVIARPRLNGTGSLASTASESASPST